MTNYMRVKHNMGGALLHSNRKRKSVCCISVLKLSTKALQLQYVLLLLLISSSDVGLTKNR